jgi:hypothetical protein
MNLNVSNVFDTGDIENYVENEVLRQHSFTTAPQRVVTLGFSYQWGGVSGDERIRNGAPGMFRGGGREGSGSGREGGGGGRWK